MHIVPVELIVCDMNDYQALFSIYIVAHLCARHIVQLLFKPQPFPVTKLAGH